MVSVVYRATEEAMECFTEFLNATEICYNSNNRGPECRYYDSLCFTLYYEETGLAPIIHLYVLHH